MKLKWKGDYSADGRFLIQAAHIRHSGTEYRLLESDVGSGPPYTKGHGIYNTRREVKAKANAIVDTEDRAIKNEDK